MSGDVAGAADRAIQNGAELAREAASRFEIVGPGRWDREHTTGAGALAAVGGFEMATMAGSSPARRSRGCR